VDTVAVMSAHWTLPHLQLQLFKGWAMFTQNLESQTLKEVMLKSWQSLFEMQTLV